LIDAFDRLLTWKIYERGHQDYQKELDNLELSLKFLLDGGEVEPQSFAIIYQKFAQAHYELSHEASIVRYYLDHANEYCLKSNQTSQEIMMPIIFQFYGLLCIKEKDLLLYQEWNQKALDWTINITGMCFISLQS
jgi:hypothetical protein